MKPLQFAHYCLQHTTNTEQALTMLNTETTSVKAAWRQNQLWKLYKLGYSWQFHIGHWVWMLQSQVLSRSMLICRICPAATWQAYAWCLFVMRLHHIIYAEYHVCKKYSNVIDPCPKYQIHSAMAELHYWKFRGHLLFSALVCGCDSRFLHQTI